MTFIDLFFWLFIGLCCFGIVYLASSAANSEAEDSDGARGREAVARFKELCFVLSCTLALMASFAMFVRHYSG